MKFVSTTARNCLTDTFVKAVAGRYHYEWKDLKKLRQVAAGIRKALEGQEGFSCILPNSGGPVVWEGGKQSSCYAGVIQTLGEPLDRLQDAYSRVGDMEAAYMIEVISSELLKNCYLQFSDWLSTNTCYEAAAFHFFGETGLPVEHMQKLLSCQGERKVTCNASYCLEPKKSVLFLAELRPRAGAKKSFSERTAISEQMCAACERKDCVCSCQKSDREQ